MRYVRRSRRFVIGALASWLLVAVTTAPGVATPIGAGPAPVEVRMSHVGRSFLFDYGEMVIRVRYLSDTRLAWEQVKGPQAGLKAEEVYGSAVVRDDVLFFWWQEKDLSVVSQVVDFGRGAVYTTWTSPDRKLAQFQGKIRPVE